MHYQEKGRERHKLPDQSKTDTIVSNRHQGHGEYQQGKKEVMYSDFQALLVFVHVMKAVQYSKRADSKNREQEKG